MGGILGQVSFSDSPIKGERFQKALDGCLLKGFPVIEVERSPTARIIQWGGERPRKQTNKVAVALDGELHSARELAHTLNLDKQAPAVELVAVGWGTWQQHAPERFLGDFAAAIYEPKKRRAVLLRDHIGTRPLYWHMAQSIVSFATFLPDLLTLLADHPQPNETAVAAYLRWPTAFGHHTFFTGVQALQPGHTAVIDASGPHVSRWWFPENTPEIRFANRDDYGEAFRALTETAVKDRLSLDKTVGAHFSGGIDSMAVALIATEALRAKGRNLSAAYSWSPSISPSDPRMSPDDERLRIKPFSDNWVLPMRYGTMTGKAFRRFLERPFEMEGLADVLDEFPILDQAKEDGTEILLSGWGGDEAFSSAAYGVPAWLLINGHLKTLAGFARARGGLRRPDLMASFLWKQALVPLLPDAAFRRFGPYSRALEDGCYPAASLLTRLREQERFGGSRLTSDPRRDIREILSMHHLAERMATWAAWGAPRGIEYRYPLTDRRLIEFVLGVPPDVLWGDKFHRFLAREAAKKYVKGGLNNPDPANERMRLRAFLDCWQMLGDEARTGRFDDDCPWLDMATLRHDLRKGPGGTASKDVGAFARIFPAVRVWHMWRRFHAVEPNGRPLA